MLAVVLSLFAADPAGDALPATWDLVLRFGLTPVMVLVLVFAGKWPTPQSYAAAIKRAEDAEARADRNEGKVDEMVAMFRNEVTPALVSATTTNADSQRMLQRLTDRMTS